jgi:hypothetical protein
MSKAKKEKSESISENIVELSQPEGILPMKIEEAKPKEVVEPPKPVYRKEADKNLPFDERIKAFLEGKNGYVRINDFLKSLYPLPKMNEPAEWLSQGASKTMRGLLEKMKSEGRIIINGDHYKMLGRFYYEGTDQVQRHYNIGNIFIEAMG